MELLDIDASLGDIVRTSYNLERANRLARENPEKLVQVSEKIVDDQIEKVVECIIDKRYKFVLLAGPSSSGKTTTTHFIANKLMNKGVRAVVVSLDDFFIDLDKCPLQPDGTVDKETISKLDLPLFNKFFTDIMKTNKAQMPEFDFTKQKRKEKFVPIEVSDGDVVLVEGTHALNPELITNNSFSNKVLKVFICANSEFYIGKEVVITPRRLRLIRRIVRDMQTRGTKVEETVKYWNVVCKGEDLYIGPYKDSADFIVDTTHIYEPLVYDKFLPKLLKPIQSERFAKELLGVFGRSASLSKKYVPDSSLLWEFLVSKEND